MKIIKVILVLFGALTVLLGSAVLLLLTPWFQKTVLLAALENRVEGAVDFEEIHLLPGSLALKNLSYAEKGWDVFVGEARLEFSLRQALMDKEIRISTIKVSGLKLDISGILVKKPSENLALPAETSTPTVSSANNRRQQGIKLTFPGVFPYADIGYGLWVDRLSVEGKILFTASREMEFVLSGGDIQPGVIAPLRLKGSLIDKSPDAPVSRLRFDAEAALAQDSESGFSGLRIIATVYARGAAFDGEIALREDISVKKNESGGESHYMRVAVIDPFGEEEVLFDLHDEYDPKNSEFRGRFKLNTSSGQLKPFAMGIPLPDFRADGSCTFEYSLASRSGSLKASIDVQLNNLENISPELRDVPPLGIHTEMDLEQQESGYWVNKLMATIDDLSEGKRVLNLASSSPFQVNFRANDFGFNQAKGNLLSLDFDELPVDWFAHLSSEVILTGGLLSGKVVLAKENGNLKVRITEPLKIAGISFSQGGKDYFEDIDIYLRGHLGFFREELHITLNTLEIRSGSSLLLEGNLEASLELTANGPGDLKAGGSLTTRLQELYRQPFANLFPKPLSTPLNLEQSFQIVVGKETLHIANLTWNLVTDAGQVFVHGETLQAISFPIQFEEDSWFMVDQSGDLAGLKLSELPVELLAPYIRGYQLSGDTISGEFVFASSNQNFEMRPQSVFSAEGISLARNGRFLLKDISIRVEPAIVLGENKLELSWKDLGVRAGENSMLSGNGELAFDFSREPVLDKVSGDIQADIAYLARQPFFSRFSNADSGLVALSGVFDLKDEQSFSGQVLIKDLQSAKTPENKIKRGLFSFEGNMADGRIQLRAPITLQGNGGDSDILLNLLFEPRDEGARFQISAQGESLVLADMVSLADFFEPVEEFARPAKTAKSFTGPVKKRDLKPFWSGYTGEVRMDFERVIYPGVGQLDKLKAVFRASPNQLFLEANNSGSTRNPLDLKGQINFNAGNIKPYSLEAELDLSNFDAGSFLRQGDPQQRPMVEGIFDLAATLHGEAENLDVLLETAQGEFTLESQSGGIFRALPWRGQKGQRASLLLGGLDLLAGDKVRLFNTANRAANLLREVKFDEMKIKAVRGTDLNLNMTDLLVRGPEIIISGVGSVTYGEGIPFLDQPLMVKAQLAAKDEAAYLLNELGHLRDRQTEDGYYLGPSFAIRGTLGNPDKSELERLLKSSTLGFFGVSGRKVDLNKSDQTEESAESETVPVSEQLQPDRKPSREEEFLKNIFKIIRDG